MYVGTLLGPYFGRTVHKEYAEEETHEWLWEVYTLHFYYHNYHTNCHWHILIAKT